MGSNLFAFVFPGEGREERMLDASLPIVADADDSHPKIRCPSRNSASTVSPQAATTLRPSPAPTFIFSLWNPSAIGTNLRPGLASHLEVGMIHVLCSPADFEIVGQTEEDARAPFRRLQIAKQCGCIQFAATAFCPSRPSTANPGSVAPAGRMLEPLLRPRGHLAA